MKLVNSALAFCSAFVGLTSPMPARSQAPGDLPPSQVDFRAQQFHEARIALANAARAANLAYEDSLSDADVRAGWKRVSLSRGESWFGKSETIFVIRANDEAQRIEIAIRGTANFDDARIDLEKSAIQDALLGFPVHQGFAKMGAQIHEYVIHLPEYERIKDYQFHLAGHSLGGAVASVLAMRLHQTRHNIGMVSTFGAPKFVTNEGARKYQVLNKRTYRVVRCDDVIPFLPPPKFFGWATGGYEMNGTVVLLLKHPHFDLAVNTDFERDFTAQLRKELLTGFNRGRLATGHRMDKYIASLENFERSRSAARPMFYTNAQRESLCPEDF